jgi:hypothetical protein
MAVIQDFCEEVLFHESVSLGLELDVADFLYLSGTDFNRSGDTLVAELLL